MVAGIGSSTGSAANWADAIFSKLDTKQQGYIDKAGLQDALTAASAKNGKDGGGAADIDATFSALDSDSDGKITKSELTDAMTKVGDQLNAQFDAARVGRGGSPPGGSPPGGPHGPRGGGGGDGDGDGASASATASTTTAYDAAADTDGNGKVSSDEEAAYKKLQASGAAADKHDPMRELARTLQLLKAYADDGGAGGIGVTA